MKLFVALCAGAVLLSPFPARADDLGVIFKKVGELVEAKNFPKALDELGWARKEIEKLHAQKLQSFFPEDLGGYKGGKLESNGALGFMTLERPYSKEGKTVKVSLTGGGGGAQSAGLGNLAQFGRMAAMMGGGAPGQETLRIGGRTATLEDNNGRSDLTIFLDSGPILKLEMTESGSADAVKGLAGAMDLDGLERYLKG